MISGKPSEWSKLLLGIHDSSSFARISIGYRLDLQGRVSLTLQLGYSFEGEERLVFSEEVDILTAGLTL